MAKKKASKKAVKKVTKKAPVNASSLITPAKQKQLANISGRVDKKIKQASPLKSVFRSGGAAKELVKELQPGSEMSVAMQEVADRIHLVMSGLFDFNRRFPHFPMQINGLPQYRDLLLLEISNIKSGNPTKGPRGKRTKHASKLK